MDNKFRETRIIKRMTQEYLEKKTGLSQTMISLIENGHYQPSDSEKRKLAKALHLSVDEIWPEKVTVRGNSILTGKGV